MANGANLNALRAVEATIRRGGYPAASDELGVTPEAVGQLVRGLEKSLGLPLFLRQQGRKGLSPTPAAQAIAPQLAAAFSSIDQALDDLATFAARPMLTLAAPPDLTTAWLSPKLAAFGKENPDISVRLDVSSGLEGPSQHGAEVVIAPGAAPSGAANVVSFTTEDRYFPVVAPVLLARSPILSVAAGISTQTLIETQAAMRGEAPGWLDWFRVREGEERGSLSRLPVPDEAAAVNAALAGEGVALLCDTAVRAHVSNRLLVVIGGDSGLSMGALYHATTVRRPGPSARRMMEWLAQVTRPARA